MHITIVGRRWFQKSYGNTYFTATIEIDGKRVHETLKEYGYGDYYQQAAWDWLDKNIWPDEDSHLQRIRYPNGSHEAPWQWAERTGNTISNHVSDVARERDL